MTLTFLNIKINMLYKGSFMVNDVLVTEREERA